MALLVLFLVVLVCVMRLAGGVRCVPAWVPFVVGAGLGALGSWAFIVCFLGYLKIIVVRYPRANQPLGGLRQLSSLCSVPPPHSQTLIAAANVVLPIGRFRFF